MTDRFADWRTIVEGIPGDARVDAAPFAVRVEFAGIVLRFQLDTSDRWCLDEILGDVRLHVEQMAESSYWLSITSLADPTVNLACDIGTLSGRGTVALTGTVNA